MTCVKYQLQVTEIEESLLCLAWKKEGWLKRCNVGILSILTLTTLFAYWQKPEQFYLFVLPASMLIFLFLLLYGFDYERRQRAKVIMKQGGFYHFKIMEDGIHQMEKQEKQCFENGKSEVFLSENVISLRIKRDVYCIPKRVLSHEELEEVLRIFRDKCIVRKVKTERSING